MPKWDAINIGLIDDMTPAAVSGLPDVLKIPEVPEKFSLLPSNLPVSSLINFQLPPQHKSSVFLSVLHEDAPITRSNIWHSDGSVVLQAENTQFRDLPQLDATRPNFGTRKSMKLACSTLNSKNRIGGGKIRAEAPDHPCWAIYNQFWCLRRDGPHIFHSDDDEMGRDLVHTVNRVPLQPGSGMTAGGCQCRKSDRKPHHRSMLRWYSGDIRAAIPHEMPRRPARVIGGLRSDLTWPILFLESNAILLTLLYNFLDGNVPKRRPA
ncbi:hypothetical protein B0H14DRAFT_2581603 [Mycena olivaceomarginata]|nr:hypothetical protein B0H14DRAFT_2581603 [Mycena olivaceomarginata]